MESGDLAEFGKKNASQIMIFLPDYMWAENNKSFSGRRKASRLGSSYQQRFPERRILTPMNLVVL